MSYWIIPRKEDIELNGGELHIWLESDDAGNKYCSIEGEALEYLLTLLKNER